MKLSRIVRLLAVINLLQAGRGQNTQSLAKECRVSRRTIFRDLDILRQAGIPLTFDEDEQRYRIERAFLLPPTNFSPEEALALLILCQELGRDSGLPFQSAARSAAMKLESSLPARLSEYLREVSGRVRIKLDAHNRLSEHEATYQDLLQAIARRRCVRIRYGSLTEWEEISTKLNPYQLLFSQRSWYVVGRSSLHRAVRTFNLGRIRELETLDEKFVIPRQFSLDQFLGNAWRMIPERGADRHVVVRFDKLVAQNVAEVHWHKTQRIEPRPDGSIDFHADVSGLSEISWWILGYADQAEVLEPPELRDLIADRGRRLVSRYEA